MPYTQDTVIQAKTPRTVIACGIFWPELEYLRQDSNDHLQIVYLEQNMHRAPHLMPERLQEQVDLASARTKQIVLCYGLCSNGLVGLRAPEQGLIVTKAHDCVALFLGSIQEYNRLSRHQPGSYYLTPGWIEACKDPLGNMENEYQPRMGREMAEWGAREELKHYTHIVYIDTGLDQTGDMRARAKENARFFNKNYMEISADLTYLHQILFGPYQGQNFFLLQTGEQVQQRWFLRETA